MTTIEDWLETFNLVKSQSGAVLSITREKMAMHAVIERHVGPMIAKAHAVGIHRAQQTHLKLTPEEYGAGYAKQTLAQLKGTQ